MIKIGKIDSIASKLTTFSVDNLGNIYLCHQDVITKLSPSFDTLFSASLKSHFPTFIQAVKNFRILTFDQERGVVQFLDNTLTPLGASLNLFDLNLVQPIHVCESFNGNSFWVLDAGTLRLLKISENFKVILEIENLSFLAEFTKHTSQMFEHNDLLYLVVPNEFMMIFDAFGTLIQKYPINSDWLYLYQNAILQYQYPNFGFINKLSFDETKACYWPIKNLLAFQITNKFLYALSENGFYKGVINQSTPSKNK